MKYYSRHDRPKQQRFWVEARHDKPKHMTNPNKRHDKPKRKSNLFFCLVSFLLFVTNLFICLILIGPHPLSSPILTSKSAMIASSLVLNNSIIIIINDSLVFIQLMVLSSTYVITTVPATLGSFTDYHPISSNLLNNVYPYRQ